MIPKSTKQARIADNANVFDFTLNKEDVDVSDACWGTDETGSWCVWADDGASGGHFDHSTSPRWTSSW